tara:strand:+ start:867 stop:1028 length:162 start_codon:yes stop_codon:yes gene_type:complete
VAVMVLAFQVRNAIHVHLYGAKMVTAQVVLIKNKLAGLMGQLAKVVEKEKSHT